MTDFLRRDMSVLFEYCTRKGAQELASEILGIPGFYFTGRNFSYRDTSHDEREITAVRMLIEAGEIPDLESLAATCKKECEELVTVAGKPHNDTKAVLQAFFNQIYRLGPLLPVFPSAIEPIISEGLGRITKTYATDTYPQEYLWELFARPSERFAIQKAEDAKNEIGAYIQNNPGLLKEWTDIDCALKSLGKNHTLRMNLKNYISDFGWATTRHFTGNSWIAIEAVSSLLTTLKQDCKQKIQENKASENNLKAQEQEAITALGISEQDQRFLKVSQDLIFYKTARKDAINQSWFLMQDIWNGIARKASISEEDVGYLLPQEILDVHEGSQQQFLHADVETRKKGYTLIFYENGIRLFTGADKTGFKKEEVIFTDEGTTTSPSAEGVNDEVRNSSDNDLFHIQEGKIRVPTLSPDIAVTLKKTASVTQDPELTRYGAQPAREYRKPTQGLSKKESR